jgi:electron transfer flavoprotein alpha subunit
LAAWVLTTRCDQAAFERLGDARMLADRLHTAAGAVVVGEPDADLHSLIEHGADHVIHVPVDRAGQDSVVTNAGAALEGIPVRVVLVDGDSAGREIASRLAARRNWALVSPALMVRAAEEGRLIVTALDSTGRFAREICFEKNETVVATFRSGVAQALPRDAGRSGTVTVVEPVTASETVVSRRFIPADPAQADIRHVERLVAGGRGLGSARGFELLSRVARRLGAGVAASRAAVDHGWIGHERQVGQTGKTVAPELYLACGISGASHHWEGMAASTHIVAINSDPEAPSHQKAHLSLVADLYEVLSFVDSGGRP